MYGDKFCRLYNELGWNYAPEAFSEILLKWISVQKMEVKKALDLGCGTGILSDILYQNGIQAAGMDFSENMIQIARERNPEIPFEVGDMVTYLPEETFDLVTSTEDALNHILTIEQVCQVFKNVYQYLNPGGYFIFDVLKEDSVVPGTEIDFELDEENTGRISVVLNPDGVFSLITEVWKNGVSEFREEIHEIYYEPELLCLLLSEIGFQNVQCTDCILEDAASAGTNWYILAQKG